MGCREAQLDKVCQDILKEKMLQEGAVQLSTLTLFWEISSHEVKTLMSHYIRRANAPDYYI